MISGRIAGHSLILLLILVAGGVLRYAYNEANSGRVVLQGDATAYITYATNLLEHSTFSKDRENTPPVADAFWSPGYPGFLAATIKLAGILGLPPPKLVFNFQLLMGVLTILLTYLLARQYLPSYWPLLPAALVAMSPHLVAIGQNVLTETLFGFLLLLGLYLFVIGIARHRNRLLLLAGTSLAMAWLVNPVSVLVAPILCVSVLLTRNSGDAAGKVSALQVSALLLAPLLLVAVLWTARTAINVPEGSLKSSDRLLTNLIIGMHRDYHDTWRADPSDSTNPATQDEAEIAGSYGNFARIFLDRFSAEPASMMAWYLFYKPLVLWGWEVQVGYRDIYIYPVGHSIYEEAGPALASYVLMKNTHNLLLLLALLGMIFLAKKKQPGRWVSIAIYLPSIYVCLVYIATQADPRYSFPLRPELYLCATYCLASMVDLVKNRKKSGSRQDLSGTHLLPETTK